MLPINGHKKNRVSTSRYTTNFPFLGYASSSNLSSGFGLRARRSLLDNAPASDTPALHEGPSHILSIGSTGAGKSVMVAANALLYNGPMVVLDLRGDLTIATARYRRQLGQEVHVLDPWGLTGAPKARLDPLDMATLPGAEVESAAESVAATLLADHKIARDVYWYHQGVPLLSAAILHILETTPRADLSFNHVVDLLCNQDDVIYALAKEMDSKVRKNSYQYGAIANFLGLPNGNADTRYCVLSTVQSGLNLFRSSAVRAAMGPSTIDINALRSGKAMTLFIVIPLERLASHGQVLKLWIDTILQGLLSRTRNLNPPLMLVMDEAAQLGMCSSLKTAATYLRASGVRLWSMWQSLSQIQSIYGTDASTLINNTSALTIMPGTGLAAMELAAITGVPAHTIQSLSRDQQLVCEAGAEPRIVRMAQYWKDPLFAGRFDEIPRYMREEISSGRKTCASGR